MPRHLLLNNISHQHTRVLHQFGPQFGDNLASVLAFPTEFIELQKEYPILVRRDQPDGRYQAIVLLGLQPDENLYLSDQHPTGWDARYIPASIEKGPFLIGFQRQPGSQGEELNPVVHIDMEHPKVSEQQGQSLFLPQGGNSPYLEHISTRLLAIHQGVELASLMFAAFEQLELLEPLNIEFSLDNGEKHRLLGNYAINESRLAALRGAELEQLNQAGLLQLAYAMVSSLSNIRHLIARKNNLLRRQGLL
ncbi:SapC family protein [Chromatiaceae bacterium AAb-1]|nr:SapC family protein [Chromatiaceae bacterium AAb-1]